MRSLLSVATRVRATTPGDFLRMIVTAMAGFVVFQTIAFQVRSGAGEAMSAIQVIVILLGCAAIGVTVWAPVPGMLLGFLPLALTPILHAYGVDSLIVMVTVLTVLAIGPRWAIGALAAAYLVWLPPRVLMLPAENRPMAFVSFLAVYAALAAIGLASRSLLAARARSAARIAALEEQARLVHTRERDELARELRGALDRIDDATRSALSELRLLVGLLRSRDDDGALRQFTSLAEQTRPSAAADALAADLREGGLAVSEDVDPGADTLDVSLRRTVCRVLQESVTNALRHARRGGACRIAVTLGEEDVTVRVVSDLDTRRWATWRADGEGGFGLLGLRERVELMGGTFGAGARGARWVVEAVLPRG